MEQVENILTEVGAIITKSHIVYTSGKHGSAYVNKDAIYPHTRVISQLCKVIAEHFSKTEIEAVLAPAVGGVILSQWIAHHLSDLIGREILGVYAERSVDGDSYLIKRGYDKLIQNKKILVAEDILTTGGSVRKVVEAARAIGAQVMGVAAICNRGGVQPIDIGGVPELFALTKIQLDSWDPDSCPLCTQNVPINLDVGKGREYLNKYVSKI